MKNIFYLILGMVSLLFAGCDKEDKNLKPSYEDVNWYAIQDDPTNDLKHLIFEVYDKTGIPIFYNDTIGSQDRGLDGYGEPVIYYEILDLNYTIESHRDYVSYTLSNKEEELTDGVNFLKDRVFPYLYKGIRPQCYLLVDELILSSFNEHEEGVYRGMTATVIGRLSELKDMTEDELNRFAAEVRATAMTPYIQANYNKELQPFYSVSEIVSNGVTISLYGQTITRYGGSVPYKAYKDYGFLNPDPDFLFSSFVYTAPGRERDMVEYITEVLVGKDEAFKEQYESSALILQKYEVMKQVVAQVLAATRK